MAKKTTRKSATGSGNVGKPSGPANAGPQGGGETTARPGRSYGGAVGSYPGGFNLPPGNRPQTTGRKIVIFRRGAGATGPQALEAHTGLKLANTADAKSGVLKASEVAAAGGVVFQHLGIAMVSQAAALERAGAGGIVAAASGGAIEAVIDERVVYALPNWYRRATAGTARSPAWSEAYKVGFRDGVLSMSGAGGGGGAPGTGAVGAIVGALDIDESQATWGLQATNVVGTSFSGKGVKVAVLDTGLDFQHPDFAGRVPASQAQSFVPDVASAQDGNGHGTHCAGTACGPARSVQGPRYGIAYDAQLFIAKVLTDEGWGYDSWFLGAIDWAITNGCRIASMSIGGPPDPEEDAKFDLVVARAMEAGLLLIVASGNESGRPGFVSPVSHPASCDHAMAVAALDSNLNIAPFSNAGEPGGPRGGQIDVAGPGMDVYSAYPLPQQYRRLAGTSMATPHVAGIAALYAEENPDLTPRDLWTRLTQTARRLSLPSADVGTGLVQAP